MIKIFGDSLLRQYQLFGLRMSGVPVVFWEYEAFNCWANQTVRPHTPANHNYFNKEAIWVHIVCFFPFMRNLLWYICTDQGSIENYDKYLNFSVYISNVDCDLSTIADKKKGQLIKCQNDNKDCIMRVLRYNYYVCWLDCNKIVS